MPKSDFHLELLDQAEQQIKQIERDFEEAVQRGEKYFYGTDYVYSRRVLTTITDQIRQTACVAAYPASLELGLQNPDGLEAAISHLEALLDNQRMIHVAKYIWYDISKVELSADQLERLRHILLANIDDEHLSELSWSRITGCKLASPAFRQQIAACVESENPLVRMKAWLVWDALEMRVYHQTEEELETFRQWCISFHDPHRTAACEKVIEVWRYWLNIAHSKWSEEYLEESRILGQKYHNFAIWRDLELFLQRDPTGLETMVVFLEADLYFFRSGYLKEELLDNLKHFDLSAYEIRLQQVILNVVDKHYCREFRYYCRLAPRIDSPSFREALEKRTHSDNLSVQQRARWVLNALLQSDRQNAKGH